MDRLKKTDWLIEIWFPTHQNPRRYSTKVIACNQEKPVERTKSLQLAVETYTIADDVEFFQPASMRK